MSKKYRGKLCVYCGKNPSTTADHVFAREFFLVRHRDNLPKVPACSKCNGDKSALELYLSAILPLGARHSYASETIDTMVPKRLEQNAKLQRELRDGSTGDKLPLRSGQIESFFTLIAKGLAWYHWGALLGEGDCAAATLTHSLGAVPLNNILSRLKPKNRVFINLGEGTFIYEGLQTIDSPQSTLWRFLSYGGACFAENSRDPDGKHSLIFAVTGPRSLLPSFWETVFKEQLPPAA